MGIQITGTGSFIPKNIISNKNFLQSEFYAANQLKLEKPAEDIIANFRAITGIEERRYADREHQASDIGYFAARLAIEDSRLDAEKLDGIIVAQNFGDIPFGAVQSGFVPSIAARIKHHLKIKNPNCVAYDVVFGCPGWIQGVILARDHILAGNGSRFLVIGAETLSRVVDPYDRDSMIFSDGAGATVIEKTDDHESGILSVSSQSHTYKEVGYLGFEKSHKKEHLPETRFIKMQGRKIYEFSLSVVPQAMQTALEKTGIPLQEVKKIFIHQANEKMDDAIISRFYRLYELDVPENVVPMSIKDLGNSSVATIPTLLDLVRKGQQPVHSLHKGDVIMFASVGAGMNVNAIVYRV